jgi:hypothetical protein
LSADADQAGIGIIRKEETEPLNPCGFQPRNSQRLFVFATDKDSWELVTEMPVPDAEICLILVHAVIAHPQRMMSASATRQNAQAVLKMANALTPHCCCCISRYSSIFERQIVG